MLGSCARAILHESHACRSWPFAVERRFGAAWMKGLCGTKSWPVPAQFCYSCDIHEKTRKQWRFFCARFERLLVRSGGDEIARSDDLIAVIQDGSFQGMTVAPEAFELSHGLPR